MTATPQTSADAYKRVLERGEDVVLRRRVAAAIGMKPRTVHALAQAFPDKSANAIRPRINELVRMGCVERDGKRANPSGHDAYVHHLTDRGEAYVRGEVDPEPEPPIAELKADVVDVARSFTRGECDEDVLTLALHRHDEAKRRRDPEAGL